MKQPSITICYILPVSSIGNYQDYARRFLTSLLLHTDDIDWDLIVVSNGGDPEPWALKLFDFPNVKFISRSNEGQDIGGYIEAARNTESEMIVVFGVTAYVKKSGWLWKLVEAWNKHGAGMYGTLTSFEIRAHINTTGFACPPSLLREYPLNVTDRSGRYEFEHGVNALYAVATRKGLPVYLVTWSGVYALPHWRSAANIYRSGDQSNCLTFWHHCDKYDEAGPIMRSAMTDHADGKRNPAGYVRNAAHL